MDSAICKARESRCSSSTGRPAAWRNTIIASAVPVRCGTISRVARASQPPTVITCGCIPCHQSQFRSCWRCNEDQLTSMSPIRPNRASNTDTNSVSSGAIIPVRGHHAPSILFPSLDAKVSRTGPAGRLGPAVLIVRVAASVVAAVVHPCRCSTRSSIKPIDEFSWDATPPIGASARFMRQPFAIRSTDPRNGPTAKSPCRDLDRNTVRGTEATVDNETARW